MSEATELPMPLAHLPRAAKRIYNQRFGSLVALWPCDKGIYGIRWVCACDCGGFALRYAAKLSEAKDSACAACNAEAQRGFKELLRDSRRERLVANYYEFGELWSPDSLSALTIEIAEEVAERLGIDVPDPELSSDVWVDPLYFDNTVANRVAHLRREWPQAPRQKKPNRFDDPLIVEQLATVLARTIASAPSKEPEPLAPPTIRDLASLTVDESWVVHLAHTGDWYLDSAIETLKRRIDYRIHYQVGVVEECLQESGLFFKVIGSDRWCLLGEFATSVGCRWCLADSVERKALA